MHVVQNRGCTLHHNQVWEVLQPATRVQTVALPHFPVHKYSSLDREKGQRQQLLYSTTFYTVRIDITAFGAFYYVILDN